MTENYKIIDFSVFDDNFHQILRIINHTMEIIK